MSPREKESRENLVAAYLEGGMSRRTLIRRLVAGGVSVGAAMSYARLLEPERALSATSAASPDFYPLVKVSIVSNDLDVVIAENRVKVQVSSTEAVNTAFFRSFMGQTAGLRPLGLRTFSPGFLPGAGQRNCFVTVDGATIGDRATARIWIHLRAFDNENRESLAVASRDISR